MNLKNVFVTVGTTDFDSLISTITDSKTIAILKEKKCKYLKLQIGKGNYIPDTTDIEGISIEYYRYKDSLNDDIMQADLVIGHAGAGTCLEVLEAQKPYIAVINEALMDNHQIELAEKMSKNQHLFYCNCTTLADVLKNADFTSIKPFVNDNGKQCAVLIENFLKGTE